MPYNPIEWVDGELLLTAARMRYMENQYQAAVNDIDVDIREDITQPLTSDVRASEPSSPNIGRIYYDSTTGALFGYDGVQFVQISEV